MYYKDLLTKDLDDPADQFAWLDSQLSAAALNHEKVGNGLDMCGLNRCRDSFKRKVKTYRIMFTHFGIHRDLRTLKYPFVKMTIEMFEMQLKCPSWAQHSSSEMEFSLSTVTGFDNRPCSFWLYHSASCALDV